MKHAPRFFLLGIGTLCLSTISSRTLADDFTGFPLTPRVSGMGLGGTNELISGEGMAALLGNENGIWLVDAQGKTAFQSSYVGSIGTGFRILQNDERILGAYVFGDGNVSATNHEYWFVSPGVESLGTLMDFRMNGYIPVGTQRNLTGTDFADNFGNYNYVTFTGHDQFDAIVNNYEEVGWGLDGEAGVRLAQLRGARVYAGGYHFNIPNGDDINGFSGRVQVPINSFIEFNVRDSYDNDQHNTIEVGLRFTLGGVNKSPTDPNQPIRERLLDPIERNLATLGQGTAEPVVNEQEVVNPSALERDNIWFFSPTGTDTFMNSSSCTAENPCVNTNFTQATIDAINAGPDSPVIVNSAPSSDPSFYLAPGQYSTLTINGSTATPYTFTDDLVYGRSADFTRPDQAAFLNGAVVLNGTDSFDSVIFHNNPSFIQAIGLTLNTGSTLILTNSIVGTDEATQGYTTAIEMHDATLYAINSQIHAYTADILSPALGIHTVDNSSVINLTNSEIIAHADITSLPSLDEFTAAAGILLDSTSGDTVNLNHSTINTSAILGDAIAAPENAAAGNVFVSGIEISGGNSGGQENINLFNHSTINASADVGSFDEDVAVNGINTSDFDKTQVVNVNLNNSAINTNVTANNNSTTAEGILLSTVTSSQVMLTNSAINVNDDDNGSSELAYAAGIDLEDAATATVQLNHSTINVNESGNNADDISYGINVLTFAPNSQATIDLESGSSVTSSVNNVVASDSIQSSGINAQADTVNIGLTNSSVSALALPIGASSNGDISVMGISDTSENTTINLNKSQVSATTTLNADTTAGDLFVAGINDLTSVSDTINVTANSGVDADATVDDNTVLGNGTVYGISQNQSGLSTGNVTVSGGSHVNTDFDLGIFSSGNLQAAGIQTADDTETITLNNAKMNSTMYIGDNQSNISFLESDNIFASANTNLTISASNATTLNSDLTIDDYDQDLVTESNNNISVQNANSVTINLDNSKLEASAEITNVTNTDDPEENSNNILISNNTGSVDINVLDGSTLSASVTNANTGGQGNFIQAANIDEEDFVSGGPTTIVIQDSKLDATGTITTAVTNSGDTISAMNIFSFDPFGGNNIKVVNSQLNASGEINDVQNGLTEVEIDAININLASEFSNNTVNISQGSALTATATYDLLEGSNIGASATVNSIEAFSFRGSNDVTISNDSTLTRTVDVIVNNGAICQATLVGVQHVPSDPGGISTGTVTNCTTLTNVPFLP